VKYTYSQKSTKISASEAALNPPPFFQQ